MLPEQPRGPFFEILGGWLEADGWARRARRLGPLRYSDLGPRRAVPLPVAAVEDLSGWLVDRVDRWWEEAGRPDPFTVVVVSADTGPLVRAVLGAGPACLTALRYVMVAGGGGASPVGVVPVEEPAFLFPAGPAPGPDGPDGSGDDAVAPPATGVGPIVTFLDDIPVVADTTTGDPDTTVVAALLCLSALPFDLYRELPEGAWAEVRLAYGDDRLGEVAVQVVGAPEVAPAASGRPGEGVVATGAAAWLRRLLGGTRGGRLAVVDFWEPEPALAAGTVALELSQLARLRRSLESGPVPVADRGLGAVTWRLG